MTRVLVILGSVRPGRVAPVVGQWVAEAIDADERFELDLADLAEVALPFMDEPNHPVMRQYTKPHTIAWSERVDAADAVILVTPEYNHSYSAVLKNALDFLSQEWWRKPVGFVSYGGVAAGARGVTELESVVVALGMVKAGAAVEIPFIKSRITDGVFRADEKETAILGKQLDELVALATALRPLQNR